MYFLKILYSAPSSVRRLDQLLLPDTVFFASEEKPSLGQDETEEKVEKEEEQRRYSRQRCNSDSVLRATNPDEIRRGHERLCIRRAEAVKQRGISLLNEVDAQYSALQVVYLSVRFFQRIVSLTVKTAVKRKCTHFPKI